MHNIEQYELGVTFTYAALPEATRYRATSAKRRGEGKGGAENEVTGRANKVAEPFLVRARQAGRERRKGRGRRVGHGGARDASHVRIHSILNYSISAGYRVQVSV